MRRLLRDVGFCKTIILFIVLLISAQSQPRAESGIPKYVFFFLSDGGGMTHLEIARQYNLQVRNEGFVIVDKIMKQGSVGVMTTHAADSLSTDWRQRPPRSPADVRRTSAPSAFAPMAPQRSAPWSWHAAAACASGWSPTPRSTTPVRRHSSATCPAGATIGNHRSLFGIGTVRLNGRRQRTVFAQEPARQSPNR